MIWQFLERKSNILVLITVLSAVALRVFKIAHHLPLLPGPDEAWIVNHVLAFGSGDLNPHEFIHPTLHWYALFIIYIVYFIAGFFVGIFHSVNDFAISFIQDPTAIYLIARFFIVGIGIGTIILVYKFAKETYNSSAGLFAAIILAFSFEHVIRTMPKGDIPCAFLVSLTLLFLYRLSSNRRRRYYILAGLSCGFSIATKYYAAALLIPLAVTHLWYAKKDGILDKKVLYMAGSIFLGFFVGCPFAIIDYKSFIEFLVFQRSFLNSFSGQNGWIVYIRILLERDMGYIFGVFSLLGVLFAFKCRKHVDVIILAFLIPFFLLIGSYGYTAHHYLIPILPLLAILGGRFIAQVFVFIKEKRRLVTVMASYGLLLVFFTGVVTSANRIVGYQVVLARKDTRLLAREWIEKNVPAGSKILVDGGRLRTLVPLNESRSSLEKKKKKLRKGSFGIGKDSLSRFFELKIETVREPSFEFESTVYGENVKEFSYYLREGYEYFVLSSLLRYKGRFRDFTFESKLYESSKDPPNVDAFLVSLKKNCRLIKKFDQSSKRPGSSIYIYKLRSPMKAGEELL